MAEPVRRTPDQLRASDPGANVWVSASAGTGKTHVLTDRILRLMLAGSAPDRILALTFTKAAAAEMQNRVVRRLGDWQALADAALAAELQALGAIADADALLRARALFARALDVPGGLHIRTLHGFAQGLLAGFPLEAGLAPGFSALEQRDSRQLKRTALQDCITAAQGSDDAGFLADLAELAILKGEGALAQLLDRMIAHSGALLQLRDATGFDPLLRAWLGVEAGAQPGGALAQCGRGQFPDADLAQLAQMLRAWGTPTGRERAAAIDHWLARDDAGRAAAFAELRGFLLTGGGSLRADYAQKVEKKAPGAGALAAELAARIADIADREARLGTAVLAARALRVGHRVAHRYEVLKRARLAIDFDDMIERTVQLLGPPGIATYIGWKLDSRYDHILVDEAQDTNRRQWRIIDRLAEDFFAGEQERARSIFVVGDHKQSIYGFQGTDPDVFEEWRARTAPRALDARRPLQSVHLALSFRSGPAVLAVVNEFLQAVGGAAIGMEVAPLPHLPHRAEAGGEVVLWPVVEVGADEDSADDDSDAAAANQEAADQEMARRLAQQVAAWLRPDDPARLWLPAHGRWARAGDIQILLRRRSWLMTSLVRELYDCGVRVAGVDRLLLTEPLAVLDLLALVRFAVQPEDDLNLASLLVSPFLGWSHEQVRQLTTARAAPGGLWAALGRARPEPRAVAARDWLGQVLNLADRAGPYEFLDSILSGPLGARNLLVARLGVQANDPINELLQQALDHERANPPALAGFLAWIEAEGAEVQRDADSRSDQVRLMTVHGAKGLESPVVVLADAAGEKRGRAPDHILVDFAETGPLPVFHLRKADGWPEPVAAARAAADEAEAAEDLRLLYVALTRAADHLFIGGARAVKGTGKSKSKAETAKKPSWHQRLQPVLAGMDGIETVPSDIWGGDCLRLRAGRWTAPTAAARVAAADTRHELSEVLTSVAPPPPHPTRPLTPSAAPEPPPEGPGVAALRDAALRGRLIHHLFEQLPALPAPERAAQAQAWLQAQGAPAPQPLIAEVLQVMADPALAPLFEPEALAEAPVAGLVGDRAITGVIDRMRILPGRVLLVDFKTGLRVPETAAAAPLAHRRQMAAYVAVLQQAFPGHAIEPALVYTAGPRLLHLVPDDLAGLLPLDDSRDDAISEGNS